MSRNVKISRIKVRNSSGSNPASRANPSGMSASVENVQLKPPSNTTYKENQVSLTHVQGINLSSSRIENQINQEYDATPELKQVNRQSKDDMLKYLISPVTNVG